MRRQDEDHITDKIKDKLDGFEPAYNPRAWNRLNSRLGHGNSGSMVHVVSLLNGIIIGILLSVGGVLYYLHSGSDKQANTHQVLKNELNNLKQEIIKLKKEQTEYIVQQSQQRITPSNFTNSNNVVSPISFQPVIRHKYIFVDSTPHNISTHNSNKNNHKLRKLYPITNYDLPQYVLIPSDHISNYKTTTNIDKNNKGKNRFKFEWPDINFKQTPYEKFTGPDRVYISSNLVFDKAINKTNCISPSIGIGFAGNITEQISLFGEINFGNTTNKRKEEIKQEWYLGDIEYDSITPVHEIDSISEHKLNWNYIDVPIGMNYEVLKNNNNSIGLSLAAISRLYLKETYSTSIIYPEDQKSSISTEFDIGEHIHLFYRLRLGLSYSHQMNNRLSITAQPFYNFPIRQHSNLQIKNPSWGLNFNIIYRLKKLEK